MIFNIFHQWVKTVTGWWSKNIAERIYTAGVESNQPCSAVFTAYLIPLFHPNHFFYLISRKRLFVFIKIRLWYYGGQATVFCYRAVECAGRSPIQAAVKCLVIEKIRLARRSGLPAFYCLSEKNNLSESRV